MTDNVAALQPAIFTHDDVVREAERLLHLALEANIRVKLLGGVAVAVQAPNRPPALQRAIVDLDVITDRANVSTLERLFVSNGYRPDRMFNAASGRERRRFLDNRSGRHLDVFVDRFEMCHEIPLGHTLAQPGIAIPRPELLLTKLQVVQLTEKDLRDIYALLLERPFTQSEFALIGLSCATDWGLWKTVRLALAKSADMLDASGLDATQKQRVGIEIEEIARAVDAYPKTRKWRFRSRIGTRIRWYQLPEEVD